LGFLEDMQSENAKLIIDALAGCIVDGDLPGGCDRAGLRRLRLAHLGAVVKGVTSAMTDVAKS